MVFEILVLWTVAVAGLKRGHQRLSPMSPLEAVAWPQTGEHWECFSTSSTRGPRRKVHLQSHMASTDMKSICFRAFSGSKPRLGVLEYPQSKKQPQRRQVALHKCAHIYLPWGELHESGFVVTISQYPRYFLKKQGLFWLIVLQVQILRALSGNGFLVGRILRWCRASNCKG